MATSCKKKEHGFGRGLAGVGGRWRALAGVGGRWRGLAGAGGGFIHILFVFDLYLIHLFSHKWLVGPIGCRLQVASGVVEL